MPVSINTSKRKDKTQIESYLQVFFAEQENIPGDIVIKNLKGYKPIALDTQIYHDLNKGEILKVQISRKIPGFDPSFKIFNHITGFVKDSRNGLYEKLQEGNTVSVEIFDLNETKKDSI